MIYDIQKASMLKRIAAWMLDMIVLLIVITGVASMIAAAVDYDSYNTKLEGSYKIYEQEYGVTFNITQEEFDKMSQEEKDNYDEAYEALIADEDVLYVYNMLINLTLLITSLSILVAYLLTEFAVPAFLKNGQTVGKKVFGIAVIRTNGVRMNHISLFIRTLLGKFTIETMVPVLLVMMLMFGVTGIEATLVLLGLGVAQIVLLIVTPTNSAIHDKLADTVAVDLSSQLIFDSEQDLLEYKKKLAAEEAEKKAYF